MDKKMTVRFFIDERKKSKKTGKTPVFIRITKDGRKAESRLDLELSDSELIIWNPNSGMIDTQEDSHINDYILGLREKFNTLKSELKINRPYFSAKEVRDELLNIVNPSIENRISIFGYAQNYCDQFIFSGNRFSKSTKQKYKVALDHFRRFLTKRNLIEQQIQFLDNQIARSFISFLMTDEPEIDRIGMLEVTAAGINKKFKTIFNAAVNDELINRNPFYTNKLSNASKAQPKLNLEQIRRILLLKDLPEPTMKYVSLFKFMVLTGYSFTDAMNLRKSPYDKLENGRIFRTVARQKTGSLSHQYYTSHAMQILRDLVKYPLVKDYLLPQVTLNTMNIYLKKAADIIEVDLNMSTQVARKAFKTILSEAGIDPIVVKMLMGWHNPTDLNIIYTNYTERKLVKSLEELEIYLIDLLSDNNHHELTSELNFEPFINE